MTNVYSIAIDCYMLLSTTLCLFTNLLCSLRVWLHIKQNFNLEIDKRRKAASRQITIALLLQVHHNPQYNDQRLIRQLITPFFKALTPTFIFLAPIVFGMLANMLAIHTQLLTRNINLLV